MLICFRPRSLTSVKWFAKEFGVVIAQGMKRETYNDIGFVKVARPIKCKIYTKDSDGKRLDEEKIDWNLKSEEIWKCDSI